MLSTATQQVECFLGFNDIDNEGTFVWDDGSTSTYTNWNGGEPNDAGGSEDCAQTFASGRWSDGNCANDVNCFYCSKLGKY